MARNDSPSSASRASSTNFSSQHTVVEHPSATDLVGLVSNRLDGEASRATLAYADAQTGRETDRQQAGFSTFVTASREASFASQAGEAAGAINATNSLPALVPSASPSLPEGRSLSRQHSGTCASRRASLNSSERESTWVSRVTAKTEDLRCMFQLPEDENVMDDFLCALQKKLLLQGRMYVFEHYVCFHSNVFGYVKNKIIPLEEVTAVRKRKNLGFPNSIEISWGQGRREFFTSFLSREDAFRLVMAAWHQSAPDKAAAQMYSSAATSKGDVLKVPGFKLLGNGT